MTVCCHELVSKLLWYLLLQHVFDNHADHVLMTCNCDSLAQQDTSILMLQVLGLLSLPHLFALVTIARYDCYMSPYLVVTVTVGLFQATVTLRQPDVPLWHEANFTPTSSDIIKVICAERFCISVSDVMLCFAEGRQPTATSFEPTQWRSWSQQEMKASQASTSGRSDANPSGAINPFTNFVTQTYAK
jgi:hypothetical protein